MHAQTAANRLPPCNTDLGHSDTDSDDLDVDQPLVDPLRRLMRVNIHVVDDPHDARQSNPIPGCQEDLIVPAQPPTTHNTVLTLSYPTQASTQPNSVPSGYSPSPVIVRLVVDARPGCGGIAWPAGEVLSKYIASRGAAFLKGKQVLELGSGTGLVGLVAAHLGSTVCITDQLPLLEIMNRNIALNDLTRSVQARELNWGEPIPPDIPRPDLILAADCVYFEPAFPLLVQTLCELWHEGRPEVLFCYKKRRKADKRFFALIKKEFLWTEVTDDPDRAVYSRDAISLLRLERKARRS